MEKFTTINGWTKEKMKEQIHKKNNGKKALKGELCRYRTNDGNACAAGCFIPDELYISDFEMNGFTALAGTSHKALTPSREILDQFAKIKFPLEVAGMNAMQLQHDKTEDETEKDMRDILCAWIDENVVDAEPA